METKPQKKFSMAYDDLIAHSMDFAHRYEQHWSQFNKKFPSDFPEDFHVILKDKAMAIKTHFSDEQMLKEMASKTEILDSNVAEFVKYMTDVMYFAKKAFGENSSTYERFNIGKPLTGKNSRNTYLVKIANFVSYTHECLTALKAEGLPDTLVKSLDDIAKKIDSLQWNRVKSRYDRTDEAVERITAGNEVWGMMEQVSNAAESVYYGNPELIAHFALPRRKTKKKEEPTDTTDMNTTAS